jgi:arginase
LNFIDKRDGEMKKPEILFTPYYLEKYRPDFHSLKKADWIENLYAGKSNIQNEIIAALNLNTAGFVLRSVEKGKLPVVLAGDCHKTIAVIKGLQSCGISPALLWLDAHGDFNTFQTSPSGFIGGMSLAILTGHEDPAFLQAHDLKPFDEGKVILFDRRNLDKEEAEALARSAVRKPENMDQLLDECKKEEQIYLHFDTDVINPLDAPAMLYASPGGPRLNELKKTFELIKEKIVAVSVNIWEPALDKERKTEKAVFEILNVWL